MWHRTEVDHYVLSCSVPPCSMRNKMPHMLNYWPQVLHRHHWVFFHLQPMLQHESRSSRYVYFFMCWKYLLKHNSSGKLDDLTAHISCLSGYSTLTKGCQNSATCFSPMECCEGNLCNSAKMPTGSSLILLLVSSAITMLFLWGFPTLSLTQSS